MVLTFVLAVLIVVAFPVVARAAAPQQRFRVGPVKLEVTAAPGETVTPTIRVSGAGTMPLDIGVRLTDYYIRPDGTFVFSAPGHESYSCATWVTLPQESFQLRPGGVHDYPIAIRIPDNAEPGGHFASVVFSSTGKAPDASGVNVNVGIATVLLVTVTGGDVRRGGDVRDFAVSRSPLGRAIKSELLFENNGNVHVSVIEEVTFTNIYGDTVGKVKMDPETILPDARRYLRSTWTAPHFGWFTARATVRWGPDIVTYNVQRSSEAIGFLVVSPEALMVLGVLLLGTAAVTRTTVVLKRRASRHRRARSAEL